MGEVFDQVYCCSLFGKRIDARVWQVQKLENQILELGCRSWTTPEVCPAIGTYVVCAGRCKPESASSDGPPPGVVTGDFELVIKACATKRMTAHSATELS